MIAVQSRVCRSSSRPPHTADVDIGAICDVNGAPSLAISLNSLSA
jgi:hypothetical protein